MVKWKLEDLPAHLRRQVEAQLHGDEGGEETARTRTDGGTALRRREPNKTEAEYNRKFLGGRGQYEALAFRLPGGSRYTPDWLTVDDDGRITLHEVKGSYRHHSHGRALTAFREAAAAFPWCNWVWARRGKDGIWQVARAGGKPEPPQRGQVAANFDRKSSGR